MSENTPLLEPSFADAIAAIEAAWDLSEDQRRHWACSLRQLAKWLDRPVQTIPGALDFDPDSGRAAASRSGGRHREDGRESQGQCSGRPALVWQGASRAGARGTALA